MDATHTGMATAEAEATGVGDLPESCLSHVIALTSPRDACRCAAVSPSFREAADSDAVWARFLPPDYSTVLLRSGCRHPPPPSSSKKEAYLRLSDSAVLVDDGNVAVWLAKGSGAKCVALSARKLSLPWENGEFSWRWTPHPLSRFAEVAQLVDCTELDIYGRLPAAALTRATAYAAYLIFGTADGHRGLSFPDQETTVAIGGRSASRHGVCLCPDDAEARKLRGDVISAVDSGGMRWPARRDDGWLEVEMGGLCTDKAMTAAAEEEVVVSLEVSGWYPKRGLIVEGVEFRPV